ncbi:hypothetical protein BD410DRAFT_121450 [Rickenella mellea]|uniref:Uncharacterized protein n=1 Tax=Rickenella mellea TaxID=50990 RepID=A0A4Y7PIU3_9AGAM|nr:hypothetical protein BD410DRAFT_121450 [Rickenella mellea]
MARYPAYFPATTELLSPPSSPTAKKLVKPRRPTQPLACPLSIPASWKAALPFPRPARCPLSRRLPRPRVLSVILSKHFDESDPPVEDNKPDIASPIASAVERNAPPVGRDTSLDVFRLSIAHPYAATPDHTPPPPSPMPFSHYRVTPPQSPRKQKTGSIRNASPGPSRTLLTLRRTASSISLNTLASSITGVSFSPLSSQSKPINTISEARRRRIAKMAKLTRHLGECPPAELVFGASSVRKGEKNDVRKRVRGSAPEQPDMEEGEKVWVHVTHTSRRAVKTIQPANPRNTTETRWIKEEGGKRRKMKDFENVVHLLRQL